MPRSRRTTKRAPRRTTRTRANTPIIGCSSGGARAKHDDTPTPRAIAIAVHDRGNEDAQHCLVLRSDGTVAAIGNNSHGQLGLGDTRYRSRQQALSSVSQVTAIATGEAHSVFLHDNGSVSTVGNNECGQLGSGKAAGERGRLGVPRKLALPGRVNAIASGYSHTVLLHADGTVSACGWNGVGQLGLGDQKDQDVPQRIPGLTRVQAIASTSNTTLALHHDGTVSAWGEDGAGMGLCSRRTAKTRAKTLICSNNHVVVPQKIAGVKNVVALGATGYHGLFLHADGTVTALGENTGGELGVGDRKPHYTPRKIAGLRDVVQVTGGHTFSAAVHADGTLSIWGGTGSYLSALRVDDQVAGLAAAVRSNAKAARADWDALYYRTSPARVPGRRSAKKLYDTGSSKFIYLTQAGKIHVCGSGDFRNRKMKRLTRRGLSSDFQPKR